MIINMSSVKTEALLLFCRDLIDSYKSHDAKIFDIEEEKKEFINFHVNDLANGINAILQKNEYYIRNQKVTRIKVILKYYNFINKEIAKSFENDPKFNPSMLCFSMLAFWFKELGHESNTKEYLYFSIYPYGEIYDTLLINIKDDNFKNLNIVMLDIAEKIMVKLNSKGLND